MVGTWAVSVGVGHRLVRGAGGRVVALLVADLGGRRGSRGCAGRGGGRGGRGHRAGRGGRGAGPGRCGRLPLGLRAAAAHEPADDREDRRADAGDEQQLLEPAAALGAAVGGGRLRPRRRLVVGEPLVELGGHHLGRARRCARARRPPPGRAAPGRRRPSAPAGRERPRRRDLPATWPAWPPPWRLPASRRTSSSTSSTPCWGVQRERPFCAGKTARRLIGSFHHHPPRGQGGETWCGGA